MDRRAWQRFRRNRGAVVGLVVVAVIVVFALLGPIVSGSDPNVPDFDHGRGRFGSPLAPNAAHWLGTDTIFRDELARLASGGRLSLEVALVATIIAMGIGTAVGILSGWYKGTRVRIDALLDGAATVLLGVGVVVLLAGHDVTGWRSIGLASYVAVASLVLHAASSLRWSLVARRFAFAPLAAIAFVAACALFVLPFVLPAHVDAHRVNAEILLFCSVFFVVRRFVLTRDGRAHFHIDVDEAVMRAVDVLLAFPFLLLLMAIAAAVEHVTRTTVFLVLGLTAWTGTARVIRSKTMQVREHEYVVASRALGQSTGRILVRHILPNVAGLAVVLATNTVAAMIVAEAALSFLGLSIPPPAASWGRMLDEGRAYFSAAPWLLAAPAIAILLSVLGFNLLGEGLRDALDARE